MRLTLHNREKHLKHFFLPLIASFEQVLVQVEMYEVHSYSATITGMPPQQRCASHTRPAFSLGHSPRAITEFDHNALRSLSLPLNGLRLHNPCKYYSFTDPLGV